jgi:hypothetical protein
MGKPVDSELDNSILEAVVAPHAPTLSTPIARALLSLEFTEKQSAQMHSLLDRNNAGTLTARQRQRLEAYQRVGNFLSLMKAKARGTLAVGKARKR